VNGHHLILGELVDYLTGGSLPDTHDERYRQRLARMLVQEKGYRKADIASRRPLTVRAGTRRALIYIDFQVSLSGRIAMIVKYGPGSLVTRHRPVLAASRLVAPYQVPLAVVTNGEDADVLDGTTGNILASGLAALPSRDDCAAFTASASFDPVAAKRAEMESRIVYCYEIDGACPCDDSVCRI
jgi:hypothetical protein